MSHPDLSAPETISAAQSDSVTPSAAPGVAPGAAPAWQEQDGVLREMWLNNQTPQVISEALGRSVAAIMTRAARLGLPRRASPGRKPGQRRRDQMDPYTTNASSARAMARSVSVSQTASTVPQTSLRVCLMCLNKFESLGRHNRICPGCRNSSEYESAASLPEIHFPVS